MRRERIIVTEDGADLVRDVVTREPEQPRQLEPVPFVGTGPGRGDYEAAIAVVPFEIEYLPPRRRAA